MSLQIPGKAKAKPQGLPKKTIAAPKKGKATPKDAAASAVRDFEQKLEALSNMREEWTNNFPDAAQAQEDIKVQEDTVGDAIAVAKPLVALCEETVGGFKCTIKHSTAKYDDSQVFKILQAHENLAELVAGMITDGVISGIALDRKIATALIAKTPEYAELFQDAWKERKKLTPAITVPKF